MASNTLQEQWNPCERHRSKSQELGPSGCEDTAVPSLSSMSPLQSYILPLQQALGSSFRTSQRPTVLHTATEAASSGIKTLVQIAGIVMPSCRSGGIFNFPPVNSPTNSENITTLHHVYVPIHSAAKCSQCTSPSSPCGGATRGEFELSFGQHARLGC